MRRAIGSITQPRSGGNARLSPIVSISMYTPASASTKVSSLIVASNRLHLVWDAPKLLLLFAAWIGSALVVISMLVIASSLAFWMQNSYPVLSFAFKIREYGQYPMTIFDGLFRFVFTYLMPIGFVAFYPAQLFLRTSDVSPLAYASPLVGVAFFARPVTEVVSEPATTATQK